MIFKDIHASMPMYLFNRNAITLDIGKVTSFTPSHVDLKVPAGKMVVDVTVLCNDSTQTYTVEDALSVAYFGCTAISPDRDAILSEIETLKQASEQRLSNHAHDEDVVRKCEQLLMDNNPALREKAKNEERFANLEGKLDKLASMIETFIK